jgi:hypothetical protein
MVIYPFGSPIILTDALYAEYGGKGTGTFTHSQLQSSYLLAEQQVSRYLGTLLLPQVVTGTYAYAHKDRLITDYGYVSRLISVGISSKKDSATCDLQAHDGCGFIYDDTYGYIDFKMVAGACGFSWYSGWPYSNFAFVSTPYQVNVVYEAGLPTGTANLPGVLEALTIMAQIDLNEKEPGLVGVNEGVGDVGIAKFTSIDYTEQRRPSSQYMNILGDSPKAMRAVKILNASVRRARRTLIII